MVIQEILQDESILGRTSQPAQRPTLVLKLIWPPKQWQAKHSSLMWKAWLSSLLPRFISSMLNTDIPYLPTSNHQPNFLVNENAEATHERLRRCLWACVSRHVNNNGQQKIAGISFWGFPSNFGFHLPLIWPQSRAASLASVAASWTRGNSSFIRKRWASHFLALFRHLRTVKEEKRLGDDGDDYLQSHHSVV